MRFMQWAHDGGEDSGVRAFFLIELKGLFSIALLHFKDGSREAYHSHAFNAISWILRGEFVEHRLFGTMLGMPMARRRVYRPSRRPKVTLRNNMHKVISRGETWVLTLRGPWTDTWREFKNGKYITLTHGRKVVSVESV